MATVEHDELVFYPAFCFRASPTHFTWVKMAAVDVHRLRKRPGFEGQNIFFYLNHPICFVYLAGIIVARTDVPRRTILTLDDSSGATIDIVVLKKDDAPVPVPLQASSAPVTAAGTENSKSNTSISKSLEKEPQPQIPREMHLAATDKTDLDITSLTPGHPIKVKGTLSTFRSTMQLQLERFFTLGDTNAEMQFVDQRIRFLVEVLSVPWDLDEDDIERLRVQAEEEEEKVEEDQERVRKRQRRRVEREEKDERRIQRMWEREEKARAKEAASCMNAGIKVMRDIEKRKRMRE